jgi:hypothetical protein
MNSPSSLTVHVQALIYVKRKKGLNAMTETLSAIVGHSPQFAKALS